MAMDDSGASVLGTELSSTSSNLAGQQTVQLAFDSETFADFVSFLHPWYVATVWLAAQRSQLILHLTALENHARQPRSSIFFT